MAVTKTQWFPWAALVGVVLLVVVALFVMSATSKERDPGEFKPPVASVN